MRFCDEWASRDRATAPAHPVFETLYAAPTTITRAASALENSASMDVRFMPTPPKTGQLRAGIGLFAYVVRYGCASAEHGGASHHAVGIHGVAEISSVEVSTR